MCSSISRNSKYAIMTHHLIDEVAILELDLGILRHLGDQCKISCEPRPCYLEGIQVFLIE